MLENRPIVVISIGYILGILMGLYCKISIAFLYLIILLVYSIIKIPKNKKFKLISFRRYCRYIKIVLTKKVFIIILFSSIISNSIILYKNSQYENTINLLDSKIIQAEAIVISSVKSKEYKNVYKIKIIEVTSIDNSAKIANNKMMYLSMKKNLDINLQYGDKIKAVGTFAKPESRRNYKGFDYKEYLKTLGICGILEAKNISLYSSQNLKNIFKKFDYISCKTKELLKNNFKKEISDVLEGVLFGDTRNIDENIKENFLNSNISHVLAVSGMHVGYIIIFCRFVFEKTIGKRKSDILSIIILTFYMFIIGLSPSVVRATIMAILMLFAKIVYKKSDVWTNISLSLLILLLYNPFLLINTSLVLSYMGAIGIIIYSKILTIKNRILNIIGTALSIVVFMLPILIIYFHQIPITSLGINVCIVILIAPIIMLGLNFVVISNILSLFQKFINFNFFILLLKNILDFLKCILSINVKILLILVNFGSKIPLNKIYVITPNTIKIIIYYIVLFISLFIYRIYKPQKRYNKTFNIRCKNIISLLKYRYNQNKNKIISFVIVIVFIFSVIKITPKNLKIYFIDVGQGDSCLIVTPKNKKILIDGGGSELQSYDIGKNILLPYLLNRGIKSLDYVIVSHFDTDHVGGLLTVMEELNVKTVIISKQGEISENYERFKQIVNKKEIRVIVVGQGDSLKIEIDLYVDIFWPNNSNFISENVLNNNSIVCKLKYKSFSMLFTGDIEEIAEKEILKENLNLKADVLKVAHHGSKTSTTLEFLKAVSPKVALIGVGKNNKFGHPNDDVINRLEGLRCSNLPYR